MSTTQFDAAELSARFLDVHESQQVFRLLMDALSRPGEVFHFPNVLLSRIPPVEIPLLALLGYDTPFALTDGDSSRAHLIARATSGRLVSVESAAYVAICDATNEMLPMGLAMGSPMRPDTAVQASVHVTGAISAADEVSATIAVTGPGVETTNFVAFSEAKPQELEFLLRRHWVAPRGIDIWVIAPDGSFIGIPRTSHVQPGPTWNKVIS